MTEQNVQVSDNLNLSDIQNDPKILQAQQIQKILEQQEQIMSKYQELKSLYENNQLDLEQKELVHQQMQKLNNLYTQNKETLAKLGVLQETTNIKEDKKDKKKKKVSFKLILGLIGAVIVLIIGGVAFFLYSLLQNLDKVAKLGLTIEQAMLFLQIFTAIFLGIFIVLALTVLSINLFKIIKKKYKKKIFAIFGLAGGSILLLLTLVLGLSAINAIKNIDLDQSTQLLTANLILQDGPVELGIEPDLYIIAPVNIEFELNLKLFNKELVPSLGNPKILGLGLDCGNGQILTIAGNKFQGSCFYQKKGDYPIKLKLDYLDSQGQNSKDVSVANIVVRSQINVSSNLGENQLNNNELFVGKNPVNITYDASDIFREFQLNDYQIERDLDGDGVFDKTGLIYYTHIYTGAGVFNFAFKIPFLNNYAYSFPIRIEQSDVPIAYVDFVELDKGQYNISANFYGVEPTVSEYKFNILNKQNNKIVDTISSKNSTIQYTFPGNGLYSVQLVFITSDSKQGLAESQTIDVGGSYFQIYYDIFTKTPTKSDFEKQDDLETVKITEIPTIVRVDIKNIIPNIAGAKVQAIVNDIPTLVENNSFQATIDSNQGAIIKIIVGDSNTETYSEKEIKIVVDRDDIIGSFLVSPDTVGISPFKVKFDASATTLTDPEDKIVYFSWDFGDGNKKENLSQSIIEHTYTYDFAEENGVFYPTVTLKTKKGRELTIGGGTRMSITKPIVNVEIVLDSHPAQSASIGDSVDMSLNMDGSPTKIIWKFGNGNEIECPGRSCTNVSQVYEIPGEYAITASVFYENMPTVDGKINLIVK
ncbi:MAG: PKD domain-containing protein [Candidatus Absconditabacterales bacterium]|nr:PKD domain-containing protein [Candidatus Absconditabacterales bacterium]